MIIYIVVYSPDQWRTVNILFFSSSFILSPLPLPPLPTPLPYGDLDEVSSFFFLIIALSKKNSTNVHTLTFLYA